VPELHVVLEPDEDEQVAGMGLGEAEPDRIEERQRDDDDHHEQPGARKGDGRPGVPAEDPPAQPAQADAEPELS
jgi:hypothetical protein